MKFKRPDVDPYAYDTRIAVEILGEAPARVTETARQNWPEIPWAKVVGPHNRLIHTYDNVDFHILLTTIIADFPPPITAIPVWLM